MGSNPFSLSGCTLFLDDSASTQKIVFSEEDFIDKYKVISWDDAWLNNSGDLIKIDCGSQTDSVSYGNQTGAVIEEPKEGKSFGRNPDGTGNFYILSSLTMNGPNSSPFVPSPTPTNTSTPTQTPTSTPIPTNSPTPKPTSTIKPTNIPTPTNIEDNSNLSSENGAVNNKNEVLGINENQNDGAKAESENSEINTRKFPFAAVILIVIGVIFSGLGIYSFFKKKSNGL